MIWFSIRLTAIAFLTAALATAASAHTADISSGRIVPEACNQCCVDVRFLGTDIERMFQETQSERANVDLSPPGVLEAEIAKFICPRTSAESRASDSQIDERERVR